jgi:hypothetical protein
MTGLLTGHCHLKGHQFKLGLVNSSNSNRFKQASEKASHVFRDCKTFTTVRFRHLGHHFMKPGDFEDISVSKILHFVQGAGLLNGWTVAQKIDNGGSAWVTVMPTLLYSFLFYGWVSPMTTKIFCGRMEQNFMNYSRLWPLESLKEILIWKKRSLPVIVCPLCYAIWPMEMLLKTWNFIFGHVTAW